MYSMILCCTLTGSTPDAILKLNLGSRRIKLSIAMFPSRSYSQSKSVISTSSSGVKFVAISAKIGLANRGRECRDSRSLPIYHYKFASRSARPSEVFSQQREATP